MGFNPIGAVKDIVGGGVDVVKGTVGLAKDVGEFTIDHTIGLPLTASGYISQATGGQAGKRLSDYIGDAAGAGADLAGDAAGAVGNKALDIGGAVASPFVEFGQEVGGGFYQMGQGAYQIGKGTVELGVDATKLGVNLSPPGLIVMGSNQLAGATGGEPGRNLGDIIFS
jgi:hypothetical protein